ncbi:hypothetical protein ACWCWD_10315 [Streptomyces sp. NPDC001493]
MEEYKKSRREAEHAAALLRAALTRAGVPEDHVSHVRPLVTSTGRSYVEVGALRVRDVTALLEVLSLRRAVSDAQTAS